MAQPYPPGARLLTRPDTAAPCPSCGGLVGRGYPTCLTCADRVDAYWLADWAAQLAITGAAEDELPALVLAAPTGEYPWTCTDWAMRQAPCVVCRGELGTGPGCAACAKADQARWAWDFAPEADMTPNEHALRLAVAALRGPARDNVATYWRLSLPYLLTGELPTPAQAGRIRIHLLAGRADDLAEADGFAGMAALTDLPWRA
ncbi:hypothetical protein [Actinokineospora sp. NBRC 105648]|uniref:hypothetical protein n=1 Tax=Actinokineospora sp. NBRC 105648 TaxID=3032206 RepID=UPI0024A44A50|nr:hypothetical protein [Actinokineospora sp. NBRC 105648]GLZ41549.1 hypothetical protein Acsp05_51730 [Actinokineospora sp. NBRC 105648]